MNKNRNHETALIWLPRLIIAALMIFYALAFSDSVLSLDTSRDVFRATQISQMIHWPLLGPDIGGFIHTGPIWFYFLALPAATGSLVFVAFWVGLFASLKFLLAYLLGKALLNKPFGLLWAFMLMLPGWHVINQFIISHTNLLETLSLALLLMLYRFSQLGKAKYWYWAALIFGLGFHAHPSFLVLIVFYLPVMWLCRAQLNFKMLLWAVLIFLIPWLPYLVDQIIHDFPDYLRIISHDVLQDQVKASGKAVLEQPHLLQHWLSNMASLLYGGPERIMQFVSAHLPNLGMLMRIFYCLIILVVGLGVVLLIKDRKPLKMASYVFLALAVALLLITVLRSFTPYYMLFSVTAVFHGLFALAAYRAVQYHSALLYLLMLMLLTVGLLPQYALQHASQSSHVNLGPVMNINQQTSVQLLSKDVSLDALTVKESRAVSQLFCDQSSTINGPMAAVLDFTGGATLQFFCADFDVQLGGVRASSQQAFLLMHQSFWTALKQQPAKWVSASWGLSRQYENHTPNTGMNFEPFDNYVHPPRSLQVFGDYQDYSMTVTAESSKYLIISNILPANVQFKVSDISANGQAVELVLANATNRLYHCQQCQGDTIHWQIDLITNGLQAIDINTLNP